MTKQQDTIASERQIHPGTCICTVDVAALASLFWATGCPFCLRRFPQEYAPTVPALPEPNTALLQ